MSRTVLITGASGYVGGRIVRQLAQRPDISIRAGVNLQLKSPPSWLDPTLLTHLDLMTPESLPAACYGADCIVHLASLNEIDSAQNPERALLVNGLGTLRLLQAAEKEGVSKFIYFSTAHVYGAPLTGDISEKSLTRPVHPYAITHRVAEDFVLAAHDRNSLSGIVLRLSNSFGAPADPAVNRWSLLVNDLCRQAVTTKILSLKTSGLQRRDFITLEDVVRAVEHFLFLPASLCGDGLFNLGGENVIRVIDIAEKIAKRCQVLFGYTPAICRPEPLCGETDGALDYSIKKLKYSGFRLTGCMDDGIDSTLMLCNNAFGK